MTPRALPDYTSRPAITARKLPGQYRGFYASRYRFRALYEYNGLTILELTAPPDVPTDPSDLQLEVPGGEQHRPDLMSRRYYRSPHLAWALLEVNELSDPFTTGWLALDPARVPLMGRVMSILPVG